MHDYDRRPTTAASSGETISNIHWMSVDYEKIADYALGSHNARRAKIETKGMVRENVVRITGTTTDGRTFQIEATYFVKDMLIESEARTIVEGAVSMGPLPPVLERAEVAAVKLLEAVRSLGVEPKHYRKVEDGWANVAQSMEAWRRGDPVDTKGLRSDINFMIKYELRTMSDRLRKLFPEDRGLAVLLEEFRKALGAAARGIPDIG